MSFVAGGAKAEADGDFGAGWGGLNMEDGDMYAVLVPGLLQMKRTSQKLDVEELVCGA
jgi:hypothetical protein